MINVLVAADPRYRVNRSHIRTTVINKLKAEGIESDVEVSVSVVGRRKMHTLCKQYMNDGKEHNVLSFPFLEAKNRESFVETPDHVTQLGDIILNHPKVVEEAGEANVLVSQKMDELIEHSVLHLLGKHHEE